MNSDTVSTAVFDATAKQIPWARAIMAVLMPTTSPAVETSGPPELPGLSAASVWITSSISRPEVARSERPSADTTPAVTVDSKPSGLPIATTSWPRRSALESPSAAAGVPAGRSVRSSARSVSGSSPSTRASRALPSAKESFTGAALAIAVRDALDAHHRRADPVHDRDDGARIGVEQGAVVERLRGQRGGIVQGHGAPPGEEGGAIWGGGGKISTDRR